jgi:hypothetical protein
MGNVTECPFSAFENSDHNGNRWSEGDGAYRFLGRASGLVLSIAVDLRVGSGG